MYTPYVSPPLTEAQKAVVLRAMAEVEIAKQERAERRKRCDEDPVFKANFERDLAEKAKANKGIQGSRFADPSDFEASPSAVAETARARSVAVTQVPPHLRPAAAACQPAPEPYILPHLRIPSSARPPNLQPQTQDSSPRPSNSASSNLKPDMNSSGQQVTSHSSTSMSSNPSNLSNQGPPAVAPAGQDPTTISQTIANQQFLSQNMRDGVNIRTCEVISFYQHGPNPVEAEYELYKSSSSRSSRSSESSYGTPNAQVQTSTLQQTAQQAPVTTAVAPQSKVVSVISQAQSSSVPSSNLQSSQNAPVDDYKQFLMDRHLKQVASAAQETSQTHSKTTSGRDAADKVSSVSAPVVPESIPVLSQETAVSQSTTDAQAAAALPSTDDARFTAAEFSFMQGYVKPVKLPHQWEAAEVKELREYERLLKIRATQPRAPRIASIDEFLASRAKQGSMANKYRAPKKVTPPTSPKSKTRSPKSKSPSPKIRRPPVGIDPFNNPAWNMANSNLGDFMAHVQARVPDGKSKKYTGKVVNQPEKEDFMSTRRPGTQVWTDNLGDEEDKASAESSKKEDVELTLKTDAAETLVVTPLIVSDSVKFVPPHLRDINNVVKTQLPKPAIEVSAVVPSGPPHLRASIDVGEMSMVNTPSSVSEPVNPIPPHLRDIKNVVKTQSSNLVVETSNVVHSAPSAPLAPHLRAGINNVGKTLPSKSVVEASKDVPSAPLAPHLRAVINKVEQKSMVDVPLSASEPVNLIHLSLRAPTDHVRPSASQKPAVEIPTATTDSAPLAPHLRADINEAEHKPVVATPLNTSEPVNLIPLHLRAPTDYDHLRAGNNTVGQKPVVETLTAASAALAPHLRAGNNTVGQKPVVEALTVAPSQAAVPPHLRAGTKTITQKPVTEILTTAPPPTTLPPHLRDIAKSIKPTLPPASVVKPSTAAPNLMDQVPPHLRDVVYKVEKILSQKPAVETQIIRGGVENDENDQDPWAASPPIFKTRDTVHLAPSNAVKNVLQAAYVPPHLRNTKQPAQENLVPKMENLNVAKISTPAFVPLPLRDLTMQKPGPVEASLDNHKTKGGLHPANPGLALSGNSSKISFGSSGLNSFDEAKISDAGLDNPKENIRATQGRDATDQLLDFDGTWLEPPHWDDRGGADNRYMGSYIKEWADSVLPPSQPINTTAPEFLSGTFVIGDNKMVEPPIHGPTIPVIEPENENKRNTQTANAEAERLKASKKHQDKQHIADIQATAEIRKQMSMEPLEANPFCPTVDMYIRPATTKDLAGIVRIYNYYVNHSILPEDQKEITELDMNFVLQGCKMNDLPFIVAVQGRVPSSTDAQGRKLKKVIVPQHETVLAFTFAQIQAFGFGSANTFKGRSRMNADLHLYVDNDHQKRGVGRNILDRLLLILNQAHSFHSGADWIDPDNDKRYGRVPDRWHKVFFQVAVAKRDDTHFPRSSRFLNKSFFHETARVVNGARTALIEGSCRFADLVTFAHVSISEDCFTPHN